MNYFELYDIPVGFLPDQAAVKKAFYRLSREFHPDFHGQASEEEQAAVLEKASDVNRAYKVFSDPDET
ncbi:MAG: DnaJ domain-containing protein, partial [Bacteroidota bacterium]|nr:DnaJ domain-containing protein [Bacteroidota bacterium]